MTYGQKLKLCDLIEIAILLLFLAGIIIIFHNSKQEPEVKIHNQFYDLCYASNSPVYFPHIEVLAVKIQECESSNRHDGVWGKAGEYGIAQFKSSTFYWMAEKVGLRNPDWKNRVQQEYLLRWALMNGLKNNWTCAN